MTPPMLCATMCTGWPLFSVCISRIIFRNRPVFWKYDFRHLGALNCVIPIPGAGCGVVFKLTLPRADDFDPN
jgi:hypothetical protein